MSLWLESLHGYGGGTVDPSDPRERQEAQALHILRHLAMPVPRHWWEMLLAEDGAGHEGSYAGIVGGALAELHRVPGPLATVSTAHLVALAASVEEASVRAATVLAERPQPEELAGRLERARHKS